MIIQPEIVYCHYWRRNDLVMWDNRCTNHLAPKDYDRSQVRQGKLNWGTAPGIAGHLTLELLKAAAGLDIVYVPFRGGPPAITALLSGDIDLVSTDSAPPGTAPEAISKLRQAYSNALKLPDVILN